MKSDYQVNIDDFLLYTPLLKQSTDNPLLIKNDDIVSHLGRKLYDIINKFIPPNEGKYVNEKSFFPDEFPYNRIWNSFLTGSWKTPYMETLMPTIAAVNYLVTHNVYPCFPDEFELMMSFITQICYNQQQSPLFPLTIIFFKDKNAILNPYRETDYNNDAVNSEYFYRYWAAFTLWHAADDI